MSSCRLAVFCFICYCSRNIFKQCQFSEYGCTLVLQITKDSLFSKQCLSEMRQMLVEVEFKVFYSVRKKVCEKRYLQRGQLLLQNLKGPFLCVNNIVKRKCSNGSQLMLFLIQCGISVIHLSFHLKLSEEVEIMQSPYSLM